MLYLTPCGGVSPPVCIPCGAASCWPRVELDFAIFNPDGNIFVLENTGDPAGSLDVFDTQARLYYDAGSALLIPGGETSFPWPSMESGLVTATAKFPVDSFIFQGYSPPVGEIGVQFTLSIPAGGPTVWLYNDVIREVVDNGIILRMRAQTIEEAAGRVRVRITVSATMDPWLDGTVDQSIIGQFSSIYEDGGNTFNALREALGGGAAPCGSMSVLSGAVSFAIYVQSLPGVDPPIQVSSYYAEIYLGP